VNISKKYKINLNNPDLMIKAGLISENEIVEVILNNREFIHC
jgi:hypothetical protein